MSTSVAPMVAADPRVLKGAHRSKPQRILSGVIIAALALPIAAYFWFIHHYAVNTIFGDQWADIDVLRHLYSGRLGLGTLWTQHNEERNLFSNLVVVVLGETTHFNVVDEMYVSAVLLACAACVFIITHKSRSTSTHLIAYLPVALILFTFAQFSNTLWGFQVAWYIVMVALATALFLLERPTLNTLVVAGAIAAGVVGSFSLLQGLLIWPAGLVLLLQRRRSRPAVALWVGAAVVTTAVYFYDYKFNGPGATSNLYALHHWRTTIEFFFVAIGRVVGSFDNTNLVLIGIGIFVLALWLVIGGGVHPDEASARPLGVALILFGMLFALSVAIARSYLGLWPAHSPEYITMDLLIVLGCYFIATSRTPRPQGEPKNVRRRTMKRVALLLVVGVIGVQVVMGYSNGRTGANEWYALMTSDEHVLAGISQASDNVVLNDFDYQPEFVRQMAVVASDHHLSMFSTSTAEELNKENPYFVAYADATNEKSVGGASASVNAPLPLDVTLVPRANTPCVSLSPGRLRAIQLPTPHSAGSLPVSVSQASTVELLFFSAAPINRMDDTGAARAVDFVTVKPGDSSLNIPASTYGTVFLEGTSGITRLCPAAA